MSKAVMIIVPVAIIGIVVGLGFAGVVNIPGLTPQKKALKNSAGMYAQKDDKANPAKLASVTPPTQPVAPKDEPAAPPKTQSPKTDPEKGAEALAEVWNQIEPADLLSITKSWKDPDIARVLAHMTTDNVAQYLDALSKSDPVKGPDRASKLSRVLQDQGSVVKPEDEPAKTT